VTPPYRHPAHVHTHGVVFIPSVRGAFLRIASDISGGTPLESIKCRVTATYDNTPEAYHNICAESGFLGLWSGTPSRTIEGKPGLQRHFSYVGTDD
jgi:hypothetical protein